MRRVLKIFGLLILGLVTIFVLFVVTMEILSRWRSAPFVKWAAANAIRLDLTDSLRGRASLRPLTDALAHATVVGLGEATHGTHEFGVVRTWMIQNLAEAGLTDVMFEAPLPTALAVDAYVQGGPGTAEAALHEMGRWIHEHEAVVQLVEWLREWNLGAGRSKRIHFRGMDLGRPKLAVACLRHYALATNRVVPLPDSAAAPFFYVSGAVGRVYEESDSVTKARAAAALDAAAATMDGWGPVARDSIKEAGYRAARRCLEVLRQNHIRYVRTGDNNPARDSAMAANVLWWLDQSGRGAKAVVWAHNGHVGASSVEGSLVLGRDLRAALGASYTPVAFLFNRGTVLTDMRDPINNRLEPPAPIEVPPAHGLLIEPNFRRVGMPALALDLRDPAKPAAVTRFLESRNRSWDFGVATSKEVPVVGMHWPYVFGTAFDAIVFIDSTSASRLTGTARKANGSPGPAGG